jgi:multidrug resistance efflux pump
MPVSLVSTRCCAQGYRSGLQRYDAVKAMLLTEFLKDHRRVEELKLAMAQQRKDFEAALAQQQKATEALFARLDKHEAQIQKASAQIELRNSASKMVVENE